MFMRVLEVRSTPTEVGETRKLPMKESEAVGALTKIRTETLTRYHSANLLRYFVWPTKERRSAYLLNPYHGTFFLEQLLVAQLLKFRHEMGWFITRTARQRTLFSTTSIYFTPS
jgi:hypothetical protein